MAIRWNVRGALTDKWKITNASQLSVFAGVTYPVATRVWNGETMERIEVETLLRLARAFRTKRNPWKLLELVDDG